jgi:hypothetical protein
MPERTKDYWLIIKIEIFDWSQAKQSRLLLLRFFAERLSRYLG